MPFLVNTGTVTVYYAYNCSSAGGSGNFAADMLSGSLSSPNDDQSIANLNGVSESGGWSSTTVSPQIVGSYYLAVNSECSWSIVVENG